MLYKFLCDLVREQSKIANHCNCLVERTFKVYVCDHARSKIKCKPRYVCISWRPEIGGVKIDVSPRRAAIGIHEGNPSHS